MHKPFHLLPLLAIFVGCAHNPPPLDSRSYDIIVKNETSRPVTLVLQKESGPRQDAWLTPEEIARGTSIPNAKWGIGVVPAGKSVAARDVRGDFDKGSGAWIRVYRGEPTLGEMLKIQPDSGDRAQAPLTPGSNQFVVRMRNGNITVQPVEPAR